MSWWRWVLRTNGFVGFWCVETVDYYVIVNNNMVGPIIPGQGLRQGDSLSPYLFILCAERLSTLIRQAERRGDLHDIRICTDVPSTIRKYSSPPCTFNESSLKSISDYNCSSSKARDFKLLKHRSKRFPILKHKRKRLPIRGGNRSGRSPGACGSAY